MPGRPATPSTCRCAPTASSSSISTAAPASQCGSSPPSRTGSKASRSIAAAGSSRSRMPPNIGDKAGARKDQREMAEIERVRERERPPIKENPYERIIRQRRELAARNLTGPVVVRSEDREWFQTRQGKLKFYLDPVTFKDTPLQHWRV